MRKNLLFALSFAIAFGITLYSKGEKTRTASTPSNQWKTFIKKQGPEIAEYQTTKEEFTAAKITPPEEATDAKPSRSIASINPTKGFMVRKGRILMGEVEEKYEDENTPLRMLNTVNPKWKEIMGKSLMRFQPEETKIMVKEELPVIRIEEGAGRFLQQVTITYLQKNGLRSSFRALVDSGSGSIVETWDRSIYEQAHKRGELTLPSENESGIITK